MSKSDNIIQFPSHAKTGFVKADKIFAQTKELKIVKEKQQPKREAVKSPLIKEHREELKALVTDWVTTSNLAKKPLNYGKAYIKLYAEGLNGEVNGIEQIEESEFELCRRYLQQRIKILETVGDSRVIRKKSEWRRDRIGKIHSICKKLDISDETRKAYQLERYGKESLADFTDDDLADFYGYVRHGTPKFTMPRAQSNTLQQDRENALRVYIGVLEENAKAGEGSGYFNRQYLPFTRNMIFDALIDREPLLFKRMSEDQFYKFWSKQRVCKLKPGRTLGSGKE